MKKGDIFPRAEMIKYDLLRITNSDEIQSLVRLIKNWNLLAEGGEEGYTEEESFGSLECLCGCQGVTLVASKQSTWKMH